VVVVVVVVVFWLVSVCPVNVDFTEFPAEETTGDEYAKFITAAGLRSNPVCTGGGGTCWIGFGHNTTSFRFGGDERGARRNLAWPVLDRPRREMMFLNRETASSATALQLGSMSMGPADVEGLG